MIREFKAQNEKMKEDMNTLKSQSNGGLDGKNFAKLVCSVVQDMSEHTEKRDKLVILGLPEEAEEGTTDIDQVRNYASRMNLDPACVVDVYRDGRLRDDHRPRILKVKFNNMSVRGSFLRELRSVINPTGQGHQSGPRIWVRPDLTYNQR